MPCTVEYDGSEDRAEIERLTQMLCYVCTNYERGVRWDIVQNGNNVLGHWWKAHKEADDMRAAREAGERAAEEYRRRGLAKLTPNERAALGLNR
jgi:hypothetical protein